MTKRIGIAKTAWGWVPYAHDGNRVCGLEFPRQAKEEAKADARRLWSDAEPGLTPLPLLDAELAAYFDGSGKGFTVDVDLDGRGEFHRRAYEACRRIPYGRVLTYKELASAAGSPPAARAAGQAMAKNPIPIVIPCHRVVGSDGSLHGFGGGLDLKARLLELEKA